jgi:hypothetical protein
MQVASQRAGGMMTRLRTALLACALSCSVVPASAATVGLGGGDVDPQFITDPAWQRMNDDKCLGLYPDYRCALYDGTVILDGISSIDFRLTDGFGALIPFPDSISVDPASALGFLDGSTLFEDGFTFNLSLDELQDPLFCIACIFFSSTESGLADPRWVSIVGVNGVANPGATEQAVAAVPEPATLLLLGPAAFLLRRRFRRYA